MILCLLYSKLSMYLTFFILSVPANKQANNWGDGGGLVPIQSLSWFDLCSVLGQVNDDLCIVPSATLTSKCVKRKCFHIYPA